MARARAPSRSLMLVTCLFLASALLGEVDARRISSGRYGNSYTGIYSGSGGSNYNNVAARSATLRAATAQAATTAAFASATTNNAATNSAAVTAAVAAYTTTENVATTTQAATSAVEAATTTNAAVVVTQGEVTSAITQGTVTSAVTQGEVTSAVTQGEVTSVTTQSALTRAALAARAAALEGSSFGDRDTIGAIRIATLRSATSRSASTTLSTTANVAVSTGLATTARAAAVTTSRFFTTGTNINLATLLATTNAVANAASLNAATTNDVTRSQATTAAASTLLTATFGSSSGSYGITQAQAEAQATRNSVTTSNAATTAAAATIGSSFSSGGPAPPPPAGGDDYSILYFGPLQGKSSFFLQSSPTNVSLIVKVTPTSAISRVVIYYNGMALGAASGRSPTFNFSVPIYTYSPDDILTARPYAGRAIYQEVTYSPQFVKIPAWIEQKTRFAGNNTAGWSYLATNIPWALGPSSFDARSLPVIGFSASYVGSILVNITVNSLGTCLMTTAGSQMTVALAAASVTARSTAIVPVNVQSSFNLLQSTDAFFTPTLGGMTVSLTGSYPVNQPWAYDWVISIGPLIFGVEAAITGAPNLDINLPFKPDTQGTAFGLPLTLANRGLRVNTPIALQISTALDMGVDIELTSSGNVVPAATWVDQSLSFSSAQAVCSLELSMDVWTQNFRASLIDISTTLNFSAKKRSALRLRDATPVDIAANGTLIRNRWAPLILNTPGRFTISNVYPSSWLQVASSLSQDMAVWTSFNPALAANVMMQVQYSVRPKGGQWSKALTFVPGSNDKPLVQPELSKYDEGFILVAGQITQPNSPVSSQYPRLVYSTWDGESWSPVANLFDRDDQDQQGGGGGGGPGGGGGDGGGEDRKYDYLPILAKGGQFLVFRRVSQSGQALMAISSKDVDEKRRAITVVQDASNIRDVSIDSDDAATAMLAFQYRGSSIIQLCYFFAPETSKQDSPGNWTCNPTTFSVGAFSRATITFDSVGSYLLAYASPAEIFSMWADPNNVIHTQYYSSAQGIAQQSATLALPYTPWDMSAVVTGISGNSIVVGWQAPLPTGVFFEYALASPGRILYSPVSRVSLSESISGVAGSPLAITMAYTGSTILFTSMLRGRVRRNVSDGQFTLHDIPVSADLAVVKVTYDPPDFSRNDINVTATLQNLGLEPFYVENNGEITMFVYNPATKALIDVVHASQPATLNSGETYSVSFQWQPTVDTPEGGIVLMDAQTPTPDVNQTNNVLASDPVVFLVNRIKVTTTNGQTAITARLQVLGWLTGRVSLEAYSRPGNSPNSTTSLVGRSSVVVTPGYANTVRIPVTSPSLLASFIRLDVRGPSDSFATVDAVLPDLRYDFAFDELSVVVRAQPDGNVAVDLPVLNRGSAYARAVLVQAFLGSSTGALLTSANVDLGPYDNQTVVLSFQLQYSLSVVVFVVNGDSRFPETFSFDNSLARTIYIPSLPPSSSITGNGGGSNTAAGNGGSNQAESGSSASSSGLPPAFASGGRKPPTSASAGNSDSDGDRLGTPAIVGISIGVTIAVAAALVIGFLIWKQGNANSYTQMEEGAGPSGVECITIQPAHRPLRASAEH